jgi:prepilin-type N-terminal cleavage/methylation domain-containing protein
MPVKFTCSRQRGVTLIELMVAIAVLAIGVALAVPSFVEFRQRQVIKAAAELYMSELGERRMEIIRANPNPGNARVIDFRTVAGRLPAGVTIAAGPDMSHNNTNGIVWIDPKLGILDAGSESGSVTLAIADYRLRFDISPVGRGRICVPEGKNPGGYQPC